MMPLDELLRAIRDDATSASLTPDDRARLDAIDAALDAATLVHLIHLYYGDLDRANRTPRALLYLHVGLMGGAVDRALREAQKRGSL